MTPRLPIRQDDIPTRIRRAYAALWGHALMCCPCCGQEMFARATNAELHTDPTGYGVYICLNEDCHIQPRYRRADIEGFWGPTPKQQEAAEHIRAGELEMGRAANEDLNRITMWLRDSKWKHLLDGRYAKLSDLVIHILKSELNVEIRGTVR